MNEDPPDFLGPVDLCGNEEFEIDDDIFDIVQLLSSPPPLAPPSKGPGMNTGKSVNYNVNPKPKMSPQASPRFDLISQEPVITEEQPRMIEPPPPGGEAGDMYQDELAELEAWLQSDAVEITEDNFDSD